MNDSAALSSRMRTHVFVFIASSIFIWTMIIHDDWIDHYALLFLARRVANGQVPYRDFFMHFAPAPAYILGAWFKLFGDSVQGTRILMALCGAVTATCAYDISKNSIAGPLSWVGPVGVASAFIVGNEGLGHMTFSIPAALAAIAFAVRTERGGHWTNALFAGVFTGVAAFCTQTVGACLGVALFAALILNTSIPFRSRAVQAAWLCGGTAAVAVPVFALIAAAGAWPSFVYDLFYWSFERYMPFHSGVGWGAWLPPWSLLSQIPSYWLLIMIPALAMTWGAVWLLPLVPLYSLGHSALTKRFAGRRVLVFFCAAMLLSAFPHAGAMRVVRLTGAIWILLALELHLILARKFSTQTTANLRPERIATIVLIVFLLLASGLQQSYRENMLTIQTPKGEALVYRDTQAEYEMLKRHYKTGAKVLAWPDGTGAEYYAGLVNPVQNDYSLLAVLFTPAQLDQAGAELAAQNYPPIVILPHTYADLDQVVATFKPAKYLDEFQTDHFKQFIAENYTMEFRDGPAIGLVRKTLKPVLPEH